MTTKLLITGAAGYVADQLLPAFRERYELVLVDVTEKNRRGERVEGVIIADLIDTDRSGYTHLFEGVEAVVHLGRVRRS
jgi:uronate dehydrogenase